MVEARDSGRLLLVDIEVLERERRRSVAIEGADRLSVYTKTKRWQPFVARQSAATQAFPDA